MQLFSTFAILILLGPVHGYADVMSRLSRGAYFIGTGGRGCDNFDEAKAQSEIKKVAKMCAAGLVSAKGNVTQAKARLELVAEEVSHQKSKKSLFYMLGALHSAELNCLSQHSSDLMTQRDSRKSIKAKVRALREVTQALIKETAELAQDKSIVSKLCPLSSQQLEQDFAHRRDAFYEKCKKIITARNARKIILASIELSNLPSIENFLEQYAKLPESEFRKKFSNDLDLDHELQDSYREASLFLTQESQRLLDNVKDSNDRSLWKSLLSDKKMMKSLLDSSDSNDLRGAVCRAEASYGKGRDYLDNGLLVGSVVLTGGAAGLARVGGTAALKATKVISGARSAGVLSRGSMASLQIALGTAAAGANITTFASELDQACFSKSPNYLIDSSSPVSSRSVQFESKECVCTDTVNAKSVKENDCSLTFALGVIGLPFMLEVGSFQVLRGTGRYVRERLRGLDRYMGERLSGLKGAKLHIQALGPVIVQPYRQLAKSGSVHVVGGLLSSKKLGATVLRRVSDFDNVMKSMGFRIPVSTRVIMNERPFLSSQVGPFSINRRVFNIRDFRMPENTIAMNPILHRTNAAKNKTLLIHERTHGILGATYSNQAYVITNRTVNEALADFMAASYYGKSRIGIGALNEGTALRDIRTGLSDVRMGGRPETIKFTYSLQDGAYHNNSLLYSKVLWDIRKKIGVRNMNKMIKPIMDDLNLHRNSVTISKNNELRKHLTYFLASMKKTFQDKDLPDAIRIVDSHADKHFMSGQMNDYLLRLQKSGDFSIPSSSPSTSPMRGQAILLHGVSASTLATEGHILYNVFQPNSEK